MKRLLLLLACLSLLIGLSACGSCTPHGAYWQPSYWTPAHYDSQTYVAYYRYYETYYCSYRYSRYGGSYCHRVYYQTSEPVYRTRQVYVAAVFHARQFIPAETCK